MAELARQRCFLINHVHFYASAFAETTENTPRLRKHAEFS